MKSFITAIILLSATILSVCLNAIYVDNTADAMLKIIETIPSLDDLQSADLKDNGDDNTQGGSKNSEDENNEGSAAHEEEARKRGAAAISDLTEFWNKERQLLSLFITYENINNIQIALDQLIVFYEGEYYTDYGAQRGVLITAVKRLGEIEELSLDSIL